MAKAAILILNYNGKKYLEEYLLEILNTSNQNPVIVGDNASKDNSVTFLTHTFPNVELIQFDQNFGYAGGYNRLIAKSEFEYLVIMNSDVRTTPGWLTPLFDYLDNHPDVAAVQPKIRAVAHPKYFEYAGAAGGFIDRLGYPFCRGRVFDHVEIDSGQYNQNKQVFWVSGACFVVRRKAFLEAGGFDEDFFAHMEEIDLCWRLQRLEHKLFCIPSSLVYHVGGGTLDYGSPFKTYLNFRNGFNLLIKNLPAQTLWPTLFARIILDWLSSLRFMLQGKFSQSLAVFKAHWAIMKHFNHTIKKRKDFNSNHPHNQVVALYNKGIVWQYFIKKKKTFSELIPD